MNTALIFAGGTGVRMNSRSKPKQFLELHGKPIIIYTLEHFQFHKDIDNIIVVCLEEWIPELRILTERYQINKVTQIVPGGKTGHDSIMHGLKAISLSAKDDDIILIHDGVRPLITEKLITDNIESVKKYGTAITVEPAKESVIHSMDGKTVDHEPDRNQIYVAKAPQSFLFRQVYDAYCRAEAENVPKTIDTSHLYSQLKIPMHMVLSTKNNMKITDPADFYIFRALYEAYENEQIFGL